MSKLSMLLSAIAFVVAIAFDVAPPGW